MGSPERRPGSEARGVELKEEVLTSVAVGSPGGAVGPIPTLTPTLVPSAPPAAPTAAGPSLVAALETTPRATQPIPTASALAVPPAATPVRRTPSPRRPFQPPQPQLPPRRRWSTKEAGGRR